MPPAPPYAKAYGDRQTQSPLVDKKPLAGVALACNLRLYGCDAKADGFLSRKENSKFMLWQNKNCAKARKCLSAVIKCMTKEPMHG